MPIQLASSLVTRSEAPRASTPGGATAAKFEGLFMREMLKAMRAAKLDDGLLDSDADAHWQDLQDQIYADTLAARAPIGVAATLAPGTNARTNTGTSTRIGMDARAATDAHTQATGAIARTIGATP